MGKQITIEEIKKAFYELYPTSIKAIELEDEGDENTFVFEAEFNDDIYEIEIPDGLVITYLSFAERIIEGFLEGETFLDFVKENG